MTTNVKAAIEERELLDREFRYIKELLQEDNDDFPIPEFKRKRMLIRMIIIKGSLTLMDNMIIEDLCALELVMN